MWHCRAAHCLSQTTGSASSDSAHFQMLITLQLQPAEHSDKEYATAGTANSKHLFSSYCCQTELPLHAWGEGLPAYKQQGGLAASFPPGRLWKAWVKVEHRLTCCSKPDGWLTCQQTQLGSVSHPCKLWDLIPAALTRPDSPCRVKTSAALQTKWHSYKR